MDTAFLLCALLVLVGLLGVTVLTGLAILKGLQEAIRPSTRYVIKCMLAMVGIALLWESTMLASLVMIVCRIWSGIE